MRRFWIPVLLSEELPAPDCPPVRVKLLSERLLAFRDTSGKVGFIDEFCAHRGVSLWFGRNEENGLRCPYHGWKFDVTGQCIEVPSEPVESGYCQKIKLTSYPLRRERGGIVWTYMGPPDKQPDFPAFEWLDLPDSHRFVAKRWQECNWLQAMEGGIDSSPRLVAAQRRTAYRSAAQGHQGREVPGATRRRSSNSWNRPAA